MKLIKIQYNTYKHHKVRNEQTVLDELPAAVHAGTEPHVVLRLRRVRERAMRESVSIVDSMYVCVCVQVDTVQTAAV